MSLPLLEERRRIPLATAAAGCAAVLGLVTVAAYSTQSRPISALDLDYQPTQVQTAKASLAKAQQRVQYDVQMLKRAEAGDETQALSIFPKYGPTLASHLAPNKVHCPWGNCGPLEGKGIATDRWPTDIYSGIPTPIWDPESDPKRLRDHNMRRGEFANVAGRGTDDTYHPPVQWGLDDMRGKGNVSPVDRGVANLEKAGVIHDSWPFDVYSAVPNPAWDATEFDKEAREYMRPTMDPYQAIDQEAAQNEKLSRAGIKVNSIPTDVHDRAYNTVDGIYDRMVPVDDAPAWRQGGVARQEEPAHFLLRSHADIDGPQPKMDYGMGTEEAYPAAGEAAHDEAAHDEAAHDEAAHDEAAHDEAAHDEAAHDEAAHDEAAEAGEEEGVEGEAERQEVAEEKETKSLAGLSRQWLNA